MFHRGWVFCTVCVVTSVAWAGVSIELVPSASSEPKIPLGSYLPGETATIEVRVAQVPAGAEHLIRLMQLDFTDSDTALNPSSLSVVWDLPGSGYFVEDGDLPGRPGFRSVAYYGDPDAGDLGADPLRQVVLPGAGFVRLGEFSVTLPDVPGTYVLDVMNPTEPVVSCADDAECVGGLCADGVCETDHGAKLIYGFGLEAVDCIGMHADCVEDVTTWRAKTNDLVGGTVVLTVVPGADAGLIDSTPACDGVLPRPQNNVLRLTFDADIAEPGPGDLKIEEALPGGQFGPTDYASLFTFLVEGDEFARPRILRIAENVDQDVLGNEAWYAFRNTGDWSGVAPFAVKFRVVYGDANGSGSTNVSDLNAIWSGRGAVSDGSPLDLDGSGNVNVSDLNIAWGTRGSSAPDEPDGHLCPE